MSDERIVLGWAKPGVPLLDAMTMGIVGKLGILSVSPDIAQDARARLQCQVKLYERGADFLPVAPVVSLTESRGKDLAQVHQNTFLRQISELEGAAQCSLRISWQPRRHVCAKPTTGRAWMNTRLRKHIANEAIVERSIEFFKEFENLEFKTLTRQGTYSVQHDILLPKTEIELLFNDISRRVKEWKERSAYLTATGPWPPFSFAQPL